MFIITRVQLFNGVVVALAATNLRINSDDIIILIWQNKIKHLDRAVYTLSLEIYCSVFSSPLIYLNFQIY